MVLGIYGAGGLGREVLDIAKAINQRLLTWEKIVFIDDNRKKTELNGAEVLTFHEFKQFRADEAQVIVAIGEPEVRAMLAEKSTSNGFELATLIHPSASIGTNAEIAGGVIICHGCFVSCNTKIGKNVLIQPISIFGHDSEIGDNSVLSPLTAISGNCCIGEKTYIGISASVKEGAKIGSGSIVGMGSVVLQDIPGDVIAFGNPSRVMKNNEEHRVFK
jgi:sugar O-acyltransferase (sialic acid O-acetyltransferase NeuD family)